MLKNFCFTCRGFSLAVPLAAIFTYVALTQGVNGVGPADANATIRQCVNNEREAGRDGRACIGKFAKPCKEDPANAHPDYQSECNEREIAFWSQFVRREYAALERLLDPDQRKKLRKSQDLWDEYQSTDCRLPYALFKQEEAGERGPGCAVELNAARALQFRSWREALSGGNAKTLAGGN